jgi:hypothetical protein
MSDASERVHQNKQGAAMTSEYKIEVPVSCGKIKLERANLLTHISCHHHHWQLRMRLSLPLDLCIARWTPAMFAHRCCKSVKYRFSSCLAVSRPFFWMVAGDHCQL